MPPPLHEPGGGGRARRRSRAVALVCCQVIGHQGHHHGSVSSNTARSRLVGLAPAAYTGSAPGQQTVSSSAIFLRQAPQSHTISGSTGPVADTSL